MFQGFQELLVKRSVVALVIGFVAVMVFLSIGLFPARIIDSSVRKGIRVFSDDFDGGEMSLSSVTATFSGQISYENVQ